MWIFQNGRWMYYEADKGTTGAPLVEADKGTVDATGQNSGQPFKAFASETEYQAHLDATLKERMDRVEAKKQREIQAATTKAETDKLIEQQKFEELATKATQRADKAEAELAELRPQLEEANAALTAQLNQAMKGVAGHVAALLEHLPVAKRLEWLANNGDKLKTPALGVPATPKPAGDGGEQSPVDKYIAERNAARK